MGVLGASRSEKDEDDPSLEKTRKCILSKPKSFRARWFNRL